MIDTIACLISPTRALDDSAFGGGSVSTAFDQDFPAVKARLWLNPQHGYAPRITYWRDAQADPFTGEITRSNEGNGVLKAEFSVPKLAEIDTLNANPTEADVQVALTEATRYVRRHFGDDLPDIREWRTQRIDYAWQWDVGAQLPAYMSVMHKLRVRTYQRHPFDANEGVVWKSKGRWVKFYNKAKEQGYTHGSVLRFEVSNYKDAVRRMAEAWFGTHRGVGQMVSFPRALYVMGRTFDALGLQPDVGYGQREWLLYRLRDAFGQKHLPRAAHALTMIHEYGVAAYSDDLALMNKSTYYSWRKKLLDGGFLVVVDTDDDSTVRESDVSLEPLQLPFNQVVSPQNLVVLSDAKRQADGKNLWKIVAPLLSLAENSTPCDYIMRAIN